MNQLRVSIVQTKLVWESVAENLKMLEPKVLALTNKSDLIILPEMFTTGFSMNPAPFAEEMHGPTMQWMKEMAHKTDAVVTGSIIIKEDGKYYNRLIWMRPYGTFDVYDKRHLFTLAKEEEHYSAGTKRLIVDWKGWKICPLICYDLRFPVWSRNAHEYDLLIYVANWPAVRRHAFRSLLLARAIENQAYTIGVNRVGKDGNDFQYSGDSTLINYEGKTEYEKAEEEAIYTQVLSFEALQDFRKKRQFLNDQDKFSIHI